MDKVVKNKKDDDLQESVEGYQKEIVDMVKGIRRCSSIKMLYGFAKRLYDNENAGS